MVVAVVVVVTVGRMDAVKLEKIPPVDDVVVVLVVVVDLPPNSDDNADPAFDDIVVVGACGLLTLPSSLLPKLEPKLVMLLRVLRVALAAPEVFKLKLEANDVAEEVVLPVVDVVVVAPAVVVVAGYWPYCCWS